MAKRVIIGFMIFILAFISFNSKGFCYYNEIARIVRGNIPEILKLFVNIDSELNSQLAQPARRISREDLGRSRIISNLIKFLEEDDIIIRLTLEGRTGLILANQCFGYLRFPWVTVDVRFTKNKNGFPVALEVTYIKDSRGRRISDQNGSPLKDLLPLAYELSLDGKIKLLGNYTGLKSILKYNDMLNPNNTIILKNFYLDGESKLHLFHRLIDTFPQEYLNAEVGMKLWIRDESTIELEVIIYKDKDGNLILENGNPVIYSYQLKYGEDRNSIVRILEVIRQ